MKKTSLILLLVMTTTALISQNDKPSIAVRGEGVVRVIPDEVTINIRVEHTGENTKDLKSQNDAVVKQILQYVKKAGIADKDVRTEYLNLNKVYDYNSKTYAFAANQALSIKLRDLKQYEELMKGLVETGLNRIDGVTFSSSNKDRLESEARKKAVASAKRNAEEYASVLNQSVGKAVSISEISGGNVPQPMYKMAAMADMSSDDGATIAPGEMEIRTSVNVVFELK